MTAESRKNDRELIEEWRTKGNTKARDTLIERHQGLIKSIAAKLYYYNDSFDDAVQDGNLGLMKALEKYDPNRGTKFSTYATYWIRDAIQQQNKKIQREKHHPLDEIEKEDERSREQLEQVETRVCITIMMDRLSDKERGIIYQRYGQGITRKEIARKENKSETTIRDIEKKALKKMKGDNK